MYMVTTLLAHGKVLYVGTMGGVVAMFDSMTQQLLSRLTWHNGKVRYLLVLPDQTKACICAEVPLERQTGGRGRATTAATHHQTSPATSAASPQHHSTLNSSTSYPLIASIGNGRRRYLAHEQPQERGRERGGEDVALLVWQS